MDKDRIEGSANQAKGAIKQAAGKMTGDTKLQAEGAADKAKGKVQNAVGGAKDASATRQVTKLAEICRKARLHRGAGLLRWRTVLGSRRDITAHPRVPRIFP